MSERRCGWLGFWAWAFAGGLLLFSLVTGLSIGLFVAPFALLALVLVGWRTRAWPESLGALTGFGALCLAVAFLNWGEAGGPDAAPWLVTGAVLATAGAGGYWALTPSSFPYARR